MVKSECTKMLWFWRNGKSKKSPKTYDVISSGILPLSENCHLTLFMKFETANRLVKSDSKNVHFYQRYTKIQDFFLISNLKPLRRKIDLVAIFKNDFWRSCLFSEMGWYYVALKKMNFCYVFIQYSSIFDFWRKSKNTPKKHTGPPKFGYPPPKMIVLA